MRKTKIVCTIGPSSREEEMLTAMAQAGMNVARLNFSHGSHEYHLETLDRIKRVRKKMGMPIAILLDTKGPEIRLGDFENGYATLEDGQSFVLTTKQVLGNDKKAHVNYADLPAQLAPGNRVLLDDGSLALQVVACTADEIECQVLVGGVIGDHKGVNVPEVHLDMPYLSQQDKDDLRFGVEQDVDFVAASFVRRKEDVIDLRKYLDYNGGHAIKIIAKIENTEGIDNFDEILHHADGIMVARGDMGVEIEYERLPGLQKRFIKKCYQQGKMVITATQMLESMISHPNPTRAEMTDVANAVFDGTSAVMLSGETAMGKYPLQAVEAMAKIARQAEKDLYLTDGAPMVSYEMDHENVTNAICDAACTTASDLAARAIIALTKYGQTARNTAKFRPSVPIVAATPVEKTYYQLALSWGVFPVMAKYQRSWERLFLHAVDCAKQLDLVSDGDRVVIVAGIPLDTPGNTNIMKVQVVGQMD